MFGHGVLVAAEILCLFMCGNVFARLQKSHQGEKQRLAPTSSRSEFAAPREVSSLSAGIQFMQ
jgi:hypothetical protein